MCQASFSTNFESAVLTPLMLAMANPIMSNARQIKIGNFAVQISFANSANPDANSSCLCTKCVDDLEPRM